MNKIRKIIYIVSSPFNKRDYKRFGIGLLLESGYEVNVYDVSGVLYPEIKKHYIPSDQYAFKGLFTLNSISEAHEAFLTCSENDVVVDLGDLYNSSYRLLKTMSGMNLKFGSAFYSVPDPIFKKKSHSFFWKLRSNRPMKFLERRLLRSGFGLEPYYFSLCAGSRAIEKCRNSMYKSPYHLIPAHSLDYDIHLEKRNENDGIKKQHMVFLDSYVPFHPDWISEIGCYPCSAEIYFDTMCSCFDELERRMDMKVVIAAHPRSAYEKLPDHWRGREVVRGQTYELIKNAFLCITHASTSVNYAAILRKPLLFVTMNEIDSVVGAWTRAYAQEFQTNVINLDDTKNMFFELEKYVIDSKDVCERYVDKYVKTQGSPEKNSWLIMMEYLRSL